MDGGKIFQSTSRDLEPLINKKGWSPEQVEELYKKGVLTKWLSQKKNVHGKRIVFYDGVSGWKRGESKRVGLLAQKIGMRRDVDLWGNVYPVTVVQVQDNQVVQTKMPKDHNSPTQEIYSLQIGAGLKKWHSFTKAQMGHFAKYDIPPKAKLVEFRVTKDALLAPGTPLLVTHFVVGQFLDVRARSKGKGFQGVMKRWGFKGGPASHGASLFHRGGGSAAGGNTDPSRVWPGKRMAGRMGGDFVTTRNLQIIKINVPDGLIYIKGGIPGPKGGWIELRDAVRKPHRLPPPFPTHLPDSPLQKNRPIPKTKYLRLHYPDPYKKKRTVDWEMKWASARVALKTAQDNEMLDDDDEEGGLAEGGPVGEGEDSILDVEK